MATFDQKVQEWFISETHLLSEGRLKRFPEPSVLCRLIEGKNKKIWKYILNNVRSRCNASKIRRILTVKRYHRELENPYSFTESSHVLEKISKAEGKRSYLESLIRDLSKEIESAENELQNISSQNCILNQKSAILELMTAEYKHKSAELRSLRTLLNFHLEKNSRHTAKFYLSLDLHRRPCLTGFGEEGKEHDNIKYILKQMTSSMKESRTCEISESLLTALKKEVHKMIKSHSIADLLNILEEISHTSYMELMAKESYSAAIQSLQASKQNSLKYLEDMKQDLIQSSFSVKKTKREVEKLLELRDLKSKQYVSKDNNAELEKKFQLLALTIENASLQESIKCLEHLLKVERNKIEAVKTSIIEKSSSSNSLQLVMESFYINFNTLRTFLKKDSHIIKHIIKSFLNLHKFSNELTFHSEICVMKDFSCQLKDDVKTDNQLMWACVEKNNVLQPLLPYMDETKCTVPDILTRTLNLSKFESKHFICYKVKKLKETISRNQDCGFDLNTDVLSLAHKQYSFMMRQLGTMEHKLELCRGNFQDSYEPCKRAQIVVHDWWKQGAQFIPQIEWEGKSLKMWLDILLVLPDL